MNIIGEPILPMVNRVKKLIISNDVKVKIFTARVCHGEVAIGFIKAWCKQVFGVELEITNVKDFAMLELWDDRCKQVIHNEGKFINEEKNLY